MKNADMPASPVPVALLYEARLDSNSWERAALGLTKRELFAAIAMQGLIQDARIESSPAGLAAEATWYADALLAALEPKP